MSVTGETTVYANLSPAQSLAGLFYTLSPKCGRKYAVQHCLHNQVFLNPMIFLSFVTLFGHNKLNICGYY